MSDQSSFVFMQEGLLHARCGSWLICKPVARYPDLSIVEMIPWCECCAEFVSDMSELL